MADKRPQADLRVLLLAPTGRDGQATHALLTAAGIECIVCQSLEQLCEQTEAGAAAIMLPEEMVLANASNQLARIIQQQPVWSDLPVIVLSRAGAESPAVERALATLRNVSLIERPVRVSTLLSVIRAVLRARERQYEVRDYLARQQEAEQAVREARDIAEAASRAKDQFLAVLSHELRTPLSPVMMAIGEMLNDPTLPAHMVEDVTLVQRNVELEAKLIDDLLDVSRVISGKLRLRMETISLHDVLRHAMEVCTSESMAKKLAVVLEPRAVADRVTGDSARLQQVFWNLLKNAIKFSPDGKQINIRTSNTETGRIRVEVQDAGVGIPPDLLPLLFTAFQQGNPSVTGRFGGLGLGLAISKAVVDMHGGTIHAMSNGRDEGATFIVELDTAIQEANLTPGAVPAGNNGNGLIRVLLVEDHPDTARMMARLLSGAGHSVKVAHTVQSALKLAADEAFDVVVSDIGLPDATGYELMEQLRQRHGMKGIALTGYGMENDIERSTKAGFVDHIIKPVNISQLEAVIRRVAAPEQKEH